MDLFISVFKKTFKKVFWLPLILKVSAGLAVKVALTCRTTFC